MWIASCWVLKIWSLPFLPSSATCCYGAWAAHKASSIVPDVSRPVRWLHPELVCQCQHTTSEEWTDSCGWEVGGEVEEGQKCVLGAAWKCSFCHASLLLLTTGWSSLIFYWLETWTQVLGNKAPTCLSIAGTFQTATLWSSVWWKLKYCFESQTPGICDWV